MPPFPDLVFRVALPLPLPRIFDYLPPPGIRASTAQTGCRLRVPFARGEQVGVIVDVGVASPDTPELKAALLLLDAEPVLAGELFDTLKFCARYYHAPLGEVIATALPAVLRSGLPLPDTCAFAWTLTASGVEAVPTLRRPGKPRRLAEQLIAGPVVEDELDLRLDDWRSAARALQQRGLIERVAVPLSGVVRDDEQAPTLNPAQSAALNAIRAGAGYRTVLLDGVTGSGKTEVYLQAIRDCLAAGKQALILVPEIGLTPQTLARFRSRLGITVHAMHSGLADGERARAWTAMFRGEGRVLVGTRSAVFTPLPEAGLIVIDEEHDASYKQQDGMRYHARDIALVRAKALDIPVLLGSATPALETLHNALSGRYTHLRLGQRAGNAKPPVVRVIDVRKRPLVHGLSTDMLDAIGRCVARGEQALVFKNRRGYAPVLLCHDCGWSAQCLRCDRPMTLHAGGRTLICHHCGGRRSRPLACPDCAGLGLHPQGFGTERLQEALTERFPGVPLIRVDRETTRHRDAIEQHLLALGDRPGILVGTQMLAKGHDLPRLTLVAVVGVDEGLYSADFRAGERLAQLLIQVAGRAGRALLPGEVLLQTHHPAHPLLGTLLAGGYHAAAAMELAEREAAGFPPFRHMALLRAEAAQESDVQAFLRAAREEADTLKTTPPVTVNGPMAAPMAKRAGKARGQLLLSSSSRPALHAALREWVARLYVTKGVRKVRWSLDVDPVDLY